MTKQSDRGVYPKTQRRRGKFFDISDRRDQYDPDAPVPGTIGRGGIRRDRNRAAESLCLDTLGGHAQRHEFFRDGSRSLVSDRCYIIRSSAIVKMRLDRYAVIRI